MEGALLLVFIAFLFGAMLLIMAFGYQSIEAERAAASNAQVAEPRQVPEAPRFFANLASAAKPEPVPMVPVSLVARLEERLRHEYERAASFASQPSMEAICPDYSAYVDAVASEVERHIQFESAATTAFVADPSVGRLYGDPRPPISAVLRRQHAARESALLTQMRRARS